MIPNYPHKLNYGLGETIELLRDNIAHFTLKEISPLADQIDKSNNFPGNLFIFQVSRAVKNILLCKPSCLAS